MMNDERGMSHTLNAATDKTERSEGLALPLRTRGRVLGVWAARIAEEETIWTIVHMVRNHHPSFLRLCGYAWDL